MGCLRRMVSGRFALTALSEPLRTGVPGSVKTSVQMITGDYFMRPFANLTYSVQTGKTAFEKEFGANIFEHLSTRPEDGSMFSDLMVGFHGPETAAVAAATTFPGWGRLLIRGRDGKHDYDDPGEES